MHIVRSKQKPEINSEESLIAIPSDIIKEFFLIEDNYWIIMSNKEIFLIPSKKYRVNRSLGYPMLDGRPPKIDITAEYYICSYATAFENRPVIARCDGKSYLNLDKWIVDMHNLVEV